jgi:membrane protease YdiL (CAAX protease family)
MSHPNPEATVEAIVEPQPLDIQHDTDPADDHGPARRIPHLGHTALFVAITICSLLVSAFIVASIAQHSAEASAGKHLVPLLAGQAISYVLTILLSARIFPRLWFKTFATGIAWNSLALARQWWRLIPVGVLLSILAQLALQHLPTAKDTPVDQSLRTSAGAWSMAILGIFFAPLYEEIAFRGFLLPALATAYDWLALERSPAGIDKWQRSTAHTSAALVFGTLISSMCFALVHAQQIGFAWSVVGLLFFVSLIFSLVRIKTHSVACSTLVHATYNFVIFAVIYSSTGGFHHMEQLAK